MFIYVDLKKKVYLNGVCVEKQASQHGQQGESLYVSASAWNSLGWRLGNPSDSKAETLEEERLATQTGMSFYLVVLGRTGFSDGGVARYPSYAHLCLSSTHEG